jgi:predicted Zn-dependent protease with MMP-like domain
VARCGKVAVEKVDDLRKELEKQVKDIVKRINQLTSDKIKEFLDDAIEIEVIKLLRHREFVGFDILITFGGPNVRFIYNRGEAKILGAWGSAEVVEQVDIDKADEILKYLNDNYI